MRPLLARASGSREKSEPSRPLPPLRRRGGVRPDVSGGSGMNRGRYIAFGLVAALVVLAVDQASKWWVLFGIDLPDVGNIDILSVLSLTMVWNRGVTFGLLNGLGARGSWLLAI